VYDRVRLLVVSDNYAVRNLIEASLEAEGHHALCISSPEQVFEASNAELVWDFLMLDASKNKCWDELFVPALLQRFESDRICILSEMGDTSWRAHAESWKINLILVKPLLRQDLEKLISGCEVSKAEAHDPPLKDREDRRPCHVEELDGDSFFLAACPAMMQLHKNIRILAPVEYPVLILGESGVGKEVVAKLLHKHHARSANNFVNVNTAAIPSELLESELFGYEVGAFTGAVKAKPGKFELADKGTLLLDEIGEMSPQMQAKLLHVLQDGSFTRLGARASTHVSVRILAATNVDMEAAITEKRFREDLYYRLNAFTILVPSLRERREEIPMLMEQMALRGAISSGQEPIDFSSKLIEVAQEYHWPGNLRELRNFVTRLLVLQDQDSAYRDLVAKIRAKSSHASDSVATGQAGNLPLNSPLGMKGVVNDMKHQTESRMIKEALSASGWNRRRAASNLNISYRALLYKIQQHGLSA
jgi:two-component system response regulator AtoC